MHSLRADVVRRKKFVFVLNSPRILRRLGYTSWVEKFLVMVRALIPHRHMIWIRAFLKATKTVVKIRTKKNWMLGRKQVLFRAIAAVKALDF